MAKPGPKPKDKRLDKLNGNPGKRPPKPDAVKASGVPKPPSWLDVEGGKVWHSILKSMPPNFYASVDTIILASYCQASSMIRTAALEVKKSGITLENKTGNIVRNPACGVLSDAMGKIASLGSSLGLDPAARQSLGIYADGGLGEGGSEAETEFGDLIAIPGGKATG